MSTILKALKKLEERKASEGKRQGDIAWDILRADSGSSGSGRKRSPFIWILPALILVAAIGWFIWPQPEAQISPVFEESQTTRQALPATEKEVPTQSSPDIAVEKPRVAQPPSARADNATEPVANDATPVDSKLVVSGIAFHENEEARMAIVNDLPVMVGTVIDDMVVEHILVDRVEFSRGGESLSVLLSPEN